MSEASRHSLIELVKQHALKFAPDGEFFTLKGGSTTNYYVDCRDLNLTPIGLHCVVTNIWLAMSSLQFDCFGGPCVGADPIIGGLTFMAALSVRNHKRGFLVRKEEKEHGRGGRIVGPLKPDDRCVLIEDVAVTGESALDAIQAIEDFGAKVIHAICIVDRLAGAATAFAAKGIPFTPLLTIRDLNLPSSCV